MRPVQVLDQPIKHFSTLAKLRLGILLDRTLAMLWYVSTLSAHLHHGFFFTFNFSSQGPPGSRGLPGPPGRPGEKGLAAFKVRR